MRILVVDDEMVARTKAEILLSAYGRCETADTGGQALALAARALEAGDPFGLITVDINMPDMQGQELVKGLRGLEERHPGNGAGPAKILMITAMDDLNNMSASFWQGCQGYLVKPLTPQNLLNALELINVTPLTAA
ncbi:MAG: response regulator [Desulfovibrionaceae bacterium]